MRWQYVLLACTEHSRCWQDWLPNFSCSKAFHNTYIGLGPSRRSMQHRPTATPPVPFPSVLTTVVTDPFANLVNPHPTSNSVSSNLRVVWKTLFVNDDKALSTTSYVSLRVRGLSRPWISTLMLPKRLIPYIVGQSSCAA